MAMFRAALFLAVVSVSWCCRTAPCTECTRAQFVPGHNLVGEGFDVVRMKTMGAFVVNVQKYMIGGAHGNCTICTNSLFGNREQKLPSSVIDWRVKVKCRRAVSSKVFRSSSYVLKESTSTTSAAWKVGLSVPSVASVMVGGTLSTSSQFARSHSTQDKFFYTSHTVSCRYYSLRVKDRPTLTKDFSDSIRSLPQSYNSYTKAAFEQFISVYGTHYLRQVDLGGRVHSTTAIRTCQVAMKDLTVREIGICLSLEASVNIQGVDVKSQKEFCRKKGRKLETGQSFSTTFADRVTTIIGGTSGYGDILFSPDKQKGYQAWKRTLKTHPSVVSYDLSSLHMLVRNNRARKAALAKAISAYVLKNAIYSNCSGKCKVGHRNAGCSCMCRGHQNINSNCCPTHPGVAELTVKVERATGLWGDYVSKTDGYVKVFYGAKSETTPIIWNNNFPVWNYVARFGIVDLTKKWRMRLEVWDRDHKWDDDLLGRASFLPERGTNVRKQFGLNHGTLYVSISVVCGPSLEGSLCQTYLPTPDCERLLSYSELLQNRTSFLQENYGAQGKSSIL